MNKLVKTLFALLLIAGCSKTETASTPLTIATDNGPVEYIVEEAVTKEQMETGLMNRENLAENAGMIFNIDPVRRVAMWMKDTKIGLDMIFIDTDGTIVQIYEKAEPLSEKKIISETPIRAVIEVNAGDVQKKNIKLGNKVEHKFFKKAEAPKTEEPAKMEKAPTDQEPATETEASKKAE